MRYAISFHDYPSDYRYPSDSNTIAKLGSSGKAVRDLRAVCRQLNFAIEPLFHSYFVLNIHKHRLDISKSQLEDLATGSSRACVFVRKLEIRLLAPSLDIRPRDKRMIVNPDGTAELEKESEDGPEVEFAIQHMRDYLAPAIASLKNLQSIM
jgi:hypothetical protein